MTATASVTVLDADLWDRLADRLRILAGLSDLTILWHEVYDIDALPAGLTLQDSAIELAGQEAIEARVALLATVPAPLDPNLWSTP